MARLTLAAALLTILPPAAALAQSVADPTPDRTLQVPRVSTPPQLEDYLAGRPRGHEAAVTEFFQREPGDGTPASQPTAAYLSYDDENLYVVFVARDHDPGAVRANLTKREAIFGDDFVGIILDTFHDRRRGYLFLVNPLGIQLDGITTEGQGDDYSFDALWQSEGRLTPFGFVVRIAIPFKSLRFPERPRQTWGVALGRMITRSNEVSFWPYITRRVEGFVQQFAALEGLRDISPGRNLQFIPYGAFARARFRDSTAFDTDTEGRAGLDGKIVLRDAFTLDLTFNPDFSQVESDEPQVTTNRRFEVFFPEKRPFFIENAAFFQTPINLFFSRRVADPQVGARLTGKVGPWAIAALTIDDRAPGQLAAIGDPAHGTRTGIGVVRVQRELRRQSSVAVMGTMRDFAADENQVVSVDGRLKLNENWVAQGQAALSRSPSGAEPAFLARLLREGRHLFYLIGYEDIAEGFSAPLGFVRRTDLRQIEQIASYRWRPEGGRVMSYGPQIFARALWSHDGTLQDWFVSPEFGVELRGRTEIEIDHEEAMERFAGTEFRKRATSIGARTAWLKWLELSGGYEIGRDINFFPAAGLSPFLGNSTEAQFSITLIPEPRLRIDETYLYSRLATRDARHVRAGAPIFDNHVLRSRVSFQFTRELSLRAIVDYNAVLPNTDLVRLDRTKRIAGDLLATYLINPWTAVYVGFTDRTEALDGSFESTGRQVFVKASYLLRF